MIIKYLSKINTDLIIKSKNQKQYLNISFIFILCYQSYHPLNIFNYYITKFIVSDKIELGCNKKPPKNEGLFFEP